MKRKYEYRVIVKRVGQKPKPVRYARMASAINYMRLMSCCPWEGMRGLKDKILIRRSAVTDISVVVAARL